MNTPEKIQEAAKIGFFATLDLGEIIVQVVMVSERLPVLAYKTPADNIMALPLNALGDVKITGYKYAGELAGNEPIREGQKFRIRKTKEIIKTAIKICDWNNDRLEYPAGKIHKYSYKKSEIEPIFD